MTNVALAALSIVLIPILWGPAVSDLIKAQRHASCEKPQTAQVVTIEGPKKSFLENLVD